ncbi:hypothetical protein DL769_008167 [Monosporascus sp. CRB-8-3]|nr:hypothetical protein DL769_008167 [Monosporascus sp. CRB-8-3]
MFPLSYEGQDLKPDPTIISKHLPPKSQSMELLEHFIHCVQPTFAVLHVPSTRALVEKTYQALRRGPEEPELVGLLLIFNIFAGAALAWTSRLLEKVGATPAVCHGAFDTCSGLAVSLFRVGFPIDRTLEAVSIPIHVLLIPRVLGSKFISSATGLSSWRASCEFTAST